MLRTTTMTMVERASRAVKSAFDDLSRMSYPFFICVFGAAIVLIGEGRWASLAFAGVSFAWAIDLAETRAFAKGKSEAAAQLAAVLTSGSDTQITVDINHHTKPINVGPNEAT